MLTPKTQYSLANAKEYFKEHLCAGDYYSESERVTGQWLGQGAERLNLSGPVKQDDFLKLCDNLDPNTGQLLTQRLKTTRIKVDKEGQEREVANRRVFYDFAFSPPKSVSIVALIGGDRRIIQAHDEAIRVALTQLEQLAATRVHKGPTISDRTTSNIACAIFRHDTSRALDPHLHSHCIVFNATYDHVEGRWKALQISEMLYARKFVENVYYHELARALKRLGYQIENRHRGDFEIKGISQELCTKFSKRDQEIDAELKKCLADDPELANRNLHAIRRNIAQSKRARKTKDVQIDQLKNLWASQLSPAEQTLLANMVSKRQPVTLESGNAEAAVVWAEDHLFDRKSVVWEHDLWRHALEHLRGKEISIREIQEATAKRNYLRHPKNPGCVTLQQVLEREWDIVCLAKNDLKHLAPFSKHVSVSNPSLNLEQRQAVEKILSSLRFVTLFRGGAGTGKSYTLKEVAKGLREAGWNVQTITPQRQQAIDLEREGFGETQTVSEFLAKRNVPQGAVVIVDEAGQIGGKQMQQLLRYIKENCGRVILSGDTRQHGAVEASDALRAIEKYSGLKVVELTEIRRQDPERATTEAERAWIKQYKEAVKEASDGKITQSFDRLDRQGAIVECSSMDQQERLAELYLELVSRNQSTVVVSQTWSEIHKVNERIRQGLKARGFVGADEQIFTVLERVDLTDAQKRDKRFYTEESLLVFNRGVGRFKTGEIGRLLTINENSLVVEAVGKISGVRFQQLSHVTVCQPKELALSSGDRLQLKANGRTKDGKRLANGELVTIKQLLKNGRIKLQDGRILEQDYREFVRGYAVTSYAAQGKTVDHVLFSDSAIKPATNQQQWYVTISRGRRGIKIFTSDKTQLRENIVRSGDRELAMDMADRKFIQRLGIPLWLVRGMPDCRAYAIALRNGMLACFESLRVRALHPENPAQKP